MKLIAINRKAGEPIKSVHAIELYPDSAPVLSPKPVFLPDWGTDTGFKAVICPSYRVSRLGKAISPKFAARYYDEVALSARIFPTNSPVVPEIARPDIVKAWDGSVVIGKWQAAAPGDPFVIAPEADPTLRIGVTPEAIDIDNMIAAVSEIMTLKMGDIILPCYIEPPLTLAINDNIAYRLNNIENSLIIKIK